MSDRYIDPNRLGKIRTAPGGTGDGAARPAAPKTSPSRECPPVAPRRIVERQGEYPVQAQRRRIEGTVVAMVTIDTNGEVQNVRIVQRAGHGFDESAEAALRATRYEPARRNCEPVQTTIRVTHTFRLEDY